MSRTATEPSETIAGRAGSDESWIRVVHVAAPLAATAFAATTLLYLLDAAGLLGSSPTLDHTRRGIIADEAGFFAAFFDHQHAIWWDIALRDVLGPVALISLVVVALGLANLWGWHRPTVQLAVGALAFGALFAAVNSLLYLGELNYWRTGGWPARPAVRMVAIGRAAEGIDHVTVYPEAFGLLLVAAGLFALARAGADGLGGAVRILGYAEAGCLLGLVASEVVGLDASYDAFALATGFILGPAFLLGVAARCRSSRVSPQSASRAH